jgi:hypothetical protein
MNEIGELIHFLRNTPVRELISALERDGFRLNLCALCSSTLLLMEADMSTTHTTRSTKT